MVQIFSVDKSAHCGWGQDLGLGGHSGTHTRLLQLHHLLAQPLHFRDLRRLRLRLVTAPAPGVWV